MGNHHSHNNHHDHEGGSVVDSMSHRGSDDSSSTAPSKKTMSRSASGADIQERGHTQYLPVEKLAKILTDRAQEEEHVNGISATIFQKYVFLKYPVLAEKLFVFFHASSKAKTPHLGLTAFRQQCERFLGVLDDETIIYSYVRMFSESSKESVSDMITPDLLRSLLMTAYQVAMDHYAEGPQMCFHIQRTLKSVVDSCFHTKSQLSAQYVTHWMQANCPRLILPLHRYVVHTLATTYRTLETDEQPIAIGLDLTTPVLEKPPPFVQGKTMSNLMPMSQAWLLAGALPPLFSRPQNATPPQQSGSGLTSHIFLSKLLSSVPSHWVLLYSSDQHGLGANRFLHHVMAYKGPTVCLFGTESGNVFCVASPNEWKESHLYWGSADATVLQLLPKFNLVEKGEKLLYLNTTIRGYPKGLRAGKDPRKPIISVDGGFEKIEFRTVPYNLHIIEMWGCGDQASREKQLEVKKWEVKEAERQRAVKLSADDWLDHPDRYLLELAGRPNYSSKQS